MALEPGTRFGAYEIVGEIGAGGMGVVYRARDTKLDRDVAIKVLPASMADDPERLTRFDREAKTLASLNHPNIGQIHGLEERDGTTALILELVEGPTLADRLEQGPLSADETMRIAMQIAAALEAAHGQGIVHRDLKPANVKLKLDGTVKVLDFGIAKAMQPDVLTSAPESPILTTPATQVGVILGTAAYMSPEQAKGQPVDQRADVWAFGCLLYEMLTGQMAFGAEDVPTTLARVIANETDLGSLPGVISPAVRHTIALCLQKDPSRRLHAMGDVRLALEGAFDSVVPQAAAETARPSWRRALPVTAAVLVTGLLVGFSVWVGMRPDSRPVNRFDYDLPEDQNFRYSGRPVMALSPDGRHVVYNVEAGLFLRPMGELEPRLIPGTEPDARSPSFSPDGQAVVYWDGALNQLKRIAISGGAPVVICPVPSNVFGLSWEMDGTILFGQPEGIYRVSENGGTPELIIPTDSGTQIYGPRLLPDGDSVLFSVGPSGDWDGAQIVAESLSTGERTVLVDGGSDAHYLPTGHIVYALGDGLFAVAFDADSVTVSGGAVPLVQGVMRAGGELTGTANYGVSDDGTLVYVSGSTILAARTLVWVDREGREEPINVPLRAYEYAQLSPDGTRVAVSTFDGEEDLWVWDLERETLQRLTFDPGLNRTPIWSPDGQRVAFSQVLNGAEEIYWQAADGSGIAETLTEESTMSVVPTGFSPDGTVLLYNAIADPRDILVVPVEGPATAGEQLLASPADERTGRVSPDGRWLAYQSDESGQDEIYVRPFPEVNTGRWQVSTGGGTTPVWSRDGSELFYFNGGQGPLDPIMAVSIESGPSFRAGTPEMLFQGDYPAPGLRGAFYDVSLDGQKFLMITNTGDESGGEQPQIIIVENWLAELERLAPTE